MLRNVLAQFFLFVRPRTAETLCIGLCQHADVGNIGKMEDF